MGGSSSSSRQADFALPQQEVVSLGASALPARGPDHHAPQAPPRIAVAPSQRVGTGQVKIPFVWDKGSLQLQRDGTVKHLWTLSANFTAEVPCEVSAHFHCREQRGDANRLEYVAADTAAPAGFSQSFAAGKHSFKLEGDRAINLQRWPFEVFWRYRHGQKDLLPIVFVLNACDMQSIIQMTLEVPSSRDQVKEPRCTLLKQKVVVSGQEYAVQEIYGLAELGKDVAHDESAVGEPCVICLCEPRNTAVLPCRHLCVCEDCAGQLQYGAATRNDHCPICRGKIGGMQVFAVKK